MFGRTSHRVKHPAVQRSCGNVSGSKRDSLFMMFFLVATTYRKPKLNPPPSFLTNLNQTEPINIKAIQQCVQGMEDQQHRSPKLRRHQRQHMLQQPQRSRSDLPKSKITEKTQVFCDLDGGLLTSCYKMSFFVAGVRCQTHTLKHMYLFIYLLSLFVYCEKNPLCIFVSFSFCQKKKPYGIRTTFFVDGHYDSQRGPIFFAFVPCAPVPLSLELLSIQKCPPSFRRGDSRIFGRRSLHQLVGICGWL